MERKHLKANIAIALQQPDARRRAALREALAAAGRNGHVVGEFEGDDVATATLAGLPEETLFVDAGTEDRADEDTGDTSIRAILGNVKDAIVTVGPDGRIVSANTAAAAAFACSEHELVGSRVTDYIPLLDQDEARLERLCEGFAESAGPTLEGVAARRADGRPFTAEISVSAANRQGLPCFVLCIRDATDRLRDEQALRDSEARYRALVENAPEAIVVLDIDQQKFVDANDNACRLFKLSRNELLSVGPQAISPQLQADGMPSFGFERGYIARALKGGRPVFEWLHSDAEGLEIPCEVRLIRLPSSTRRLVRASIIDIAARRRADLIAHSERRILELIAANAPLNRTLVAIVRALEQIHSDLWAAVSLLHASSGKLVLAAAAGLPGPFKQAIAERAPGNASACGAAIELARQVLVRDAGSDPLFEGVREVAVASGIRACCATPVMTAGERVHGALTAYFNVSRSPKTEELDLIARMAQLAGIAVRRKQDENALVVSEARFRALFDNVVDGVFQATLDGRLLSVNPALVEMLGYADIGELCAVNSVELYADPKDRERLLGELTTNGRVRNFEYRLRCRDGGSVVVLENSRLVTGSGGRVFYYEGTITDITERKAAERALFNEKERAQVTLKSIGDAVVTTDAAGVVEYLNPIAEQLTGWDRRDAEGRRIEEVIKLEHDENGEPVENPVRRCLGEERVVGLTDNVALIGRNGMRVAIQDSAAPIQDRSGQIVGAVMVFHDVSGERQLRRKLSYHASHDSLTGLINRREFEERLSSAFAQVRGGGGRKHALLYMDLDQFKVVNDTCGHAAGDMLLRQLAEVLQSHVRGSDALARLGGDEFAVLLSDCPMHEALKLAELLREAIANYRFEWRDGAMQVGVSIGIVEIDNTSESVGALMSAADVACYVAKDLGRNRIHVYEEGDAAERHQEMQWVARVNRALEEKRFELYYQPIVAISPEIEAVAHYELLLRMRDDRGALVEPSMFIPAAERYNLMPGLDRWVVSETIRTLACRGPGPARYQLAVNLSGTTLNDAKFLDFVLEELEKGDLAEGALCFEITESAAIANLSKVVYFMKALKVQGCRFSLDDFGTGLSSLTYLKNLPVDYVKIDGHFIRGVVADPADRSMVEAIAHMARALNIETIAERVESREVLEKLREIGVAFAQGFYVAQPRPVKELGEAADVGNTLGSQARSGVV